MNNPAPLISSEGFRFDAEGPLACYIIHGFTGSPYEMRDLGKYIASQGITAVAEVLPGHGTSPEDCNTKVYQDWIDTIRSGYDRLSTEKKEVFILGFSMGATLALYMATEKELPGIVLYAPVIKHKRWTIHLTPLVAPFKEFEDKNQFYRKDGGRQTYYGYSVYPMKAAAEVIKLTWRVRMKLEKVTCPALIMHSKVDITVPFENGQYVYNWISSQDKQLITFNHSAHALMADCEREAVWKATTKFVKSRSGVVFSEV